MTVAAQFYSLSAGRDPRKSAVNQAAEPADHNTEALGWRISAVFYK